MAEQENVFLHVLLTAEDQASRVLEGFGGKAATVAHDAQLAIGALGLAALGATVAAVKMASDFETPMTKVFALTGISRDQFEAYKEQVLDLSTVVPKSAEDLANGLYFVVSAGFQGSDAMEILAASAKAASAGLTDTKTVADAITSALNAYKLSGKDAGDITGKLTQAVIEGKTEFGALAGSIGRVLPIAAAAGVSFDEVMASMATMTRVGLNADEAATALRGVLNALEKPTSKAADEMTHLGLFMDGATFSGDKLRAALKERGLLSVLQELMTATHGNVGELGEIIPNIRALTGVLATAGSQAEQYAGILGREKASGAAAANEAFSRTAETLDSRASILKNSLGAIGITVGEKLLPPLADLAGRMAKVAGAIREWLKENPAMADMIGKGLALFGVFGSLAGAAAILGGSLHFVSSPLIGVASSVAKVIPAVLHLAGAFLAFIPTAVAAVIPLLPIIAVVAAIGLAVLVLKTAWEKNWGDIQGKTAAVGEFLGTVFAAIGDLFDWIGTRLHDLGDMFGKAFQWIIDRAHDFFDLLPSGIRDALGLNFGEGAFGKIALDTMSDFGGGLDRGKAGVLDSLNGIVRTITDTVGHGASDVKDEGGEMMSGLGSAISNAKDWIGGQMKGLGDLLPKELTEGLGDVKGLGGKIPTDIAKGIQDAADTATKASNALGKGLGSGLAGGLASGVEGGTGLLGDAATKLVGSMTASLQQQIANLLKALPTTSGVVAAPPPGAPAGALPSVNIGGIAQAINAQVGSVIQTIGGIQYSLSAAAIARGGIPGFAAGLDAGPMLYDGLAFLHRGERVVRPDQDRRASSEPVIHRVQVFLGGKQIADGVSEQWTTAARLAGRSLG